MRRVISKKMWRFKSCPKCNGDVDIERDQWGWFEQCLQCGYLHDLENIVEVKKQRTPIETDFSSPKKSSVTALGSPPEET